MPRLEDGTVAAGEGLVRCLQRVRRHLGDGDRRYGKAQASGYVRFEEWPEARREYRMALEEVDEGRRIDQNQRTLREVAQA